MRRIFLTAALLLPLSCQAAEVRLTLKGATFEVDLAVTESERRVGLMGRTELKKNQGMLFVYPEAQRLSFWMKGTLLPLDILFFNRDGELLEFFADTPPCREEPCKTYGNATPALYVLELPAGSAKQLELKRGDTFQLVPR